MRRFYQQLTGGHTRTHARTHARSLARSLARMHARTLVIRQARSRNSSSHGFEVHHGNKEHIVLVRWLPNTPSTIPQPSSHYVGVGIAVVDDHDRILVVQEKFGPASRRGKDFWKMPTGLVDNGEDIAAAAVREVLEETGVRVRFEGVLAFRQNHKTGVEGKTDLFFLCKATPLSSEIVVQEAEIARAEWMPLKEYLR